MVEGQDMDLFTLKMIGIVTMFLDHYNYIIGGPEIFDILGIMAFPIFAFALVEGYKHTRNIHKYLFRIGISAILFQIPAQILGYNETLNIFFTLFLGLTCIYICDRFNIYISGVLSISVIILAVVIKADYGVYGMLLIICFYLGRDSRYIRMAVPLLLNIWLYFLPRLFGMEKIQVYSILALIPIYFYNGKKGRDMKYLFYIFYPAHFVILELVRRIIGR